MEFMKQNPKVRVALITVNFLLALFFVITGWKMIGEMMGLVKMLVGVAFLLVALKVYNVTFEEPKKKK